MSKPISIRSKVSISSFSSRFYCANERDSMEFIELWMYRKFGIQNVSSHTHSSLISSHHALWPFAFPFDGTSTCSISRALSVSLFTTFKMRIYTGYLSTVGDIQTSMRLCLWEILKIEKERKLTSFPIYHRLWGMAAHRLDWIGCSCFPQNHQITVPHTYLLWAPVQSCSMVSTSTLGRRQRMPYIVQRRIQVLGRR